MSRKLNVDLFVEDRAHEEFIKAVLERLGREMDVDVATRTRTGRGGHARAIDEFCLYQRILLRGRGTSGVPDVIVVAIDTNCAAFNKARSAILQRVDPALRERVVVACPDPHVEVWYLADREAIFSAVGARPKVGKRKCERDAYKKELRSVVRTGGHPPMLGGVEFAREIVEHMDWYNAGKSQSSFRHFLKKLRRALSA